VDKELEEEEEREAAVVVERNKEWRGIEVLLQLCLSQHVEWWLVETTAPQDAVADRCFLLNQEFFESGQSRKRDAPPHTEAEDLLDHPTPAPSQNSNPLCTPSPAQKPSFVHQPHVLWNGQ
jgi:hypothetical protein